MVNTLVTVEVPARGEGRSKSNEPAHFLAQAEQHLGFRIVVQDSAIQAAGGRRRESGDGIRERRYATNDACSLTRPPGF
jgi:hypothetical protein